MPGMFMLPVRVWLVHVGRMVPWRCMCVLFWPAASSLLKRGNAVSQQQVHVRCMSAWTSMRLMSRR